MKIITFECNRDGARFNLESGVTKSEALTLQEQHGERADLAEKIKMSDQFDNFYKSIKEHAKNCDGSITPDVTSYRISD